MCVYSAAKTLGLKFVPVGNERYEIVTRKEHLSDPRVAALFETVISRRNLSGLLTVSVDMIRLRLVTGVNCPDNGIIRGVTGDYPRDLPCMVPEYRLSHF